MHKVEPKRLREEVILKIVGNQEESQKEGGLNREDQTTAGTMGNQGTKERLLESKEK